MAFQIEAWERLTSNGTPLWIRPVGGDWFVPNDAGDSLLRALREDNDAAATLSAQRFLARLPTGLGVSPPPRADVLRLDSLTELWIHLTDRCDLACRHCLFSCSPSCSTTLETDRVLSIAHEAEELGCRLFVLTGGEPLVHEGFVEVVDELLAIPDSHVVVLTNGVLLDTHRDDLARWPRDRVHFQVSVDGLQQANDRIRGKGNFAKVLERLTLLHDMAWPFTVSATVTIDTVDDLPAVVELAADKGASNVHFMWFLERGRGDGSQRAEHDKIAERVCAATSLAETLGLGLDNLDALRSQVFAPIGTVHDGTNAGWESVAVGPDGRLYPTAATVGLEALATSQDDGLAHAWRNGAALDEIRRASSWGDPSPFAALLGGGDLDRRIIGHGGRVDSAVRVGQDPLLGLTERLAAWVIVREALSLPEPSGDEPALRLERGDVLESCGAHGAVALTHSNCLLSVAGEDSRQAVRDFYGRAAETPDVDILNPVAFPADLIEHIPDESRVRSYGCGSPVLDADPTAGEVVVDLGSGTGVECFIASRLVGPTGRVIGIDMLEPMLQRARRGAAAVAERLGWSNVVFERGFLEELPLDDGEADIVISNCVINLSVHKRRTFAEVLRALRPGGRLVVSDVVCDEEPPAAIRNDDQLKGECIGGALTQRHLFGLLREVGFVGTRALRRFPYRDVQGHPFFSLTYEARKPSVATTSTVRVMARGPAPAILTSTDRPLFAGQVAEVTAEEAEVLGEALFVLDEDGAVTNVDLGASSCCCAPEIETDDLSPSCCEPVGAAPAMLEEPCGCCGDSPTERHRAGCMVCGAPLEYLEVPRTAHCEYCRGQFETQTACRDGHVVCDACHAADALSVIEHLCVATTETDMIALFDQIRAHPLVPIHGPEHHAMIPAIMVTTYRNSGGELREDALKTALIRGGQVPGGFCGFAGGCGAGLGIGIGFSLLLGATPLTAKARQQALRATSSALAVLGEQPAARCCQRDGILALQRAAEISKTLLPIPLKAALATLCKQVSKNAECLGRTCQFYPTRRRREALDAVTKAR